MPGAPRKCSGRNGGRATLIAHVLNQQFNPIPDQEVTFVSASGSLLPERARTDQDGFARATLTAAPGAVEVKARIGFLERLTIASIQPASAPNADPPPNEPQPGEPLPPLVIGLSFTTPVVSRTIFFNIAGAVAPPFQATWDWGDGSSTSTSSMAATHVFSFSTTYIVTLTVRDGLGRVASRSSAVTVLTAPPIFVFVSCGVSTGRVATCTFSASEDGTPISASEITGVTFNWGDGSPHSSPTGVSAQHPYAAADSYLVVGSATVRGVSRTTSFGLAVS